MLTQGSRVGALHLGVVHGVASADDGSPLLHVEDVRRTLQQMRLLQTFTQGSWQEGAALDVVEVLRLHLLLVGLPVVEVVEVGDDDGDGEGDGEDARYRAQGTYDLAPNPHRPGERE